MAAEQKATLGPPAQARRMQLRYGFNEVDGWWHMSLGEHREQICQRLRLMDTRVIRIFVFDKPVPDPVTITVLPRLVGTLTLATPNPCA